MQLPDAQSLVTQARSLLSSRQDLAWLGIRDTRLELILATSGLAFEKTSSRPPPTLTLLLREPVRLRLRDHLRANPSPGVQSLLDSIFLPPLPHSSPLRAPGVNLSRPLFFWPLTFSIPVLSPPTSRAT